MKLNQVFLYGPFDQESTAMDYARSGGGVVVFVDERIYVLDRMSNERLKMEAMMAGTVEEGAG
jgi:hypothetical protein